MSVVKMSAHV